MYPIHRKLPKPPLSGTDTPPGATAASRPCIQANFPRWECVVAGKRFDLQCPWTTNDTYLHCTVFPASSRLNVKVRTEAGIENRKTPQLTATAPVETATRARARGRTFGVRGIVAGNEGPRISFALSFYSGTQKPSRRGQAPGRLIFGGFKTGSTPQFRRGTETDLVIEIAVKTGLENTICVGKPPASRTSTRHAKAASEILKKETRMFATRVAYFSLDSLIPIVVPRKILGKLGTGNQPAATRKEGSQRRKKKPEQQTPQKTECCCFARSWSPFLSQCRLVPLAASDISPVTFPPATVYERESRYTDSEATCSNAAKLKFYIRIT
ncbi:hypothetical protein C8R47DRAFT_1241700 [Mycena vitilis]|nr:hypothetical protein C8R47DRAFT_1241700 [Mycena vitilis]